MRIIFVGIHNKPNTPPLHSSTKSGKLIDKITEGFTHIKTNLYNCEYYPKDVLEKRSFAIDWINRIDPAQSDIIVLLGAEVHKNFAHKSDKIIKIPHPSSQWSHKSMDKYVLSAIEKIKKLSHLML